MKFVEINWNPTDRQLRQFGALSAFALPGVAWIWNGGAGLLVTLAIIGATMGVAGWIRPGVLRPAFLGLTILTLPIGIVVGEIVMLIIYFGVFLPIGLAFRLIDRDRLQLRGDPAAPTCWQLKRQSKHVASYLRQS